MERLGHINQVKDAFDSTTLTFTVHALVFGKLYYCRNVWGSTCEYNLSEGEERFREEEETAKKDREEGERKQKKK